MAANEVFNFVNKFLNLRKDGKNATLSLQCQDGNVSINLHLHLPSYPTPQYKPHPTPQPGPRYRPSPSRIRRSTRRAAARAHAEKADKENASQAHSLGTPAEQAAIASLDEKSPTQDTDAEEACTNATIDVEDNNAEEVSVQICDEKTPFQQSEVDTAEQVELIVDDSKDNCAAEKVKSDTTSADQQWKNLLICNYCDKGFANEEVLRDHTSTDHRSGRIRYRKI